MAKIDGLIGAILAHLYLAWIHPFSDGNGRTARLVEFQLLLQAGFPAPTCHLLADYYKKTRQRYYQALNETSRDPNFPVWKFVSYALRGFAEELRDQMIFINDQTLTTAWSNFVHDAILYSPSGQPRLAPGSRIDSFRLIRLLLVRFCCSGPDWQLASSFTDGLILPSNVIFRPHSSRWPDIDSTTSNFFSLRECALKGIFIALKRL